MARYEAKNSAEVAKAIRALQKKNKELIKSLSVGKMTRVLFNGCQIVEARAKEILTEKGHVVTGNLRRSINTSIVEVGISRTVVEVGTWVEYAPFVEALPDGGFLFEAAAQTFPQVIDYIAKNGIEPAVKAWGAGGAIT